MPTDFATLSLSPALVAVVGELGYQHPTPIQAKGIPLLLAGKDLIGQSKTGSGKTATFSLPILQSLAVERRELQALIICPTRELAAQVGREMRRLGRKHQGLSVLELVGGQPVRPQIDALTRGVHIAVGTPGRLLDHVKRGTLDCANLKTVVLDEADRMLDMGFGADVESILRTLPDTRQTVLFSATFPNKIEAISAAYQRDAVRVTIEDAEDEGATLKQYFLEVLPSEKLAALYWTLERFPHESALLFCNFKATVSELEQALSMSGISVDRLDGDLEQFQRDQVLAKFRNQSTRVLIATDVAGRGIDVQDLELVVNFELPAKTDIYVHRIGRTGRAGKAGVAVSLASKRELSKIQAIEQATGAPVGRLELAAGHETDVRALAVDAKMATVLISGGRKDKVRPGDILGALTGEAGGLDGSDIGRIEIQDRLSYVAIAKRHAPRAVKSINDGRIKGKRFRASLVA
jgi:ATP-independent RNA helicase DbpA